jgi:hypothetical protein
MALVDIAVSVAAASVLVEVGAQVRALHDVHPGLVYLLLDGGELSMRRSIRLTTRLPARRRCRRLGHYTPLFH